jgi:hypothetical protein
MISSAEARSIHLLSTAITGASVVGVRATDYLVAVQYLQALSQLTAARKPATVVLVPREAVKVRPLPWRAAWWLTAWLQHVTDVVGTNLSELADAELAARRSAVKAAAAAASAAGAASVLIA